MAVRLVIVGGVAGGMSAATRARRVNESASITVLEKGGFISFANCGLPYYLDGRIAPREKLLLTNPQAVASRYNIDARVGHEVMSIDRQRKFVHVRDLAARRDYELAYDKLILAQGATPIVPPIDHVQSPNVFAVRDVENIVAIDAWIKATGAKRAVIVGAGYIGLEMAETLTHAGLAVTLIEKMPHPLPIQDPEMVTPIREALAGAGVQLICGDGLKALQAQDGRVIGVQTESGRVLPADLVILSIGVRPNTAMAQTAGLAVGMSGAVQVDPYQRTSDPDIYAVGDMAEVIHGVTGQPTRVPLAGPANRAGRLAGEHAATGQSASAGRVLGTAIVQVFGTSTGITGLSEAAARRTGFAVDTAYVLPAHHASYYPGAKQLRLKLVYEQPDGRILGAQATGAEGVDKRLDVIATVMHFGGTIDDLAQLDLAYAPQFGSAKDPVHFAAFVAQNQQRGLTPATAPGGPGDGRVLLDVRTPQEFAAGALSGAINIPVDQLRERLGELDPSRPVTVYCQVGLRGHVATRILKQHGFAEVANMKGGYLMAKAAAAC